MLLGLEVQHRTQKKSSITSPTQQKLVENRIENKKTLAMFRPEDSFGAQVSLFNLMKQQEYRLSSPSFLYQVIRQSSHSL